MRKNAGIILFILTMASLYVHAAQEPSTNPFDMLNDDSIKQLTGYLGHKSAGRLRQTCKRLSKLAVWSNDPFVITLPFKEKEKHVDRWKRCLAEIETVEGHIEKYNGNNEIICNPELLFAYYKHLAYPLPTKPILHLRELVIYPTKLTETEFQNLFISFPNLETVFVHCDECRSLRPILIQLGALKKLKHIVVARWHYPDTNDFALLPQVTSLTFNNCLFATVRMPENVKYPSLRSLIMCGGRPDDAETEKFFSLFPSLEQLSVSAGSIGLLQFLNHCDNLRKLHIDCFNLVYFLDILSNLSALKNLQEVTIEPANYWRERDRKNMRSWMSETITVKFINHDGEEIKS